MTTPVIVRQAQENDLEPLCQLVHAFHEFHVFHVLGMPFRLASLGEFEAFECAELIAKLSQIIENAEAAVFVAEQDAKLIGFAEIYLRQDEPNPAVVSYKYGYLQSLMVHEKVRSRGIGRQLMTMAEAWAQSEGATEIRLETWEFALGPLKFYENLGYKTLKRTLVKELE